MTSQEVEKMHRAVIAMAQASVAIGEAVRELKKVPSGHIYAHVCHVMDLEVYQACIQNLQDAGLVRLHPSHLLEWIGPTKPLSQQQPHPELN